MFTYTYNISKLQTGTLPNVPISCLPPSRVDPKVQGLKVIIDCPLPGSSRATYRLPHCLQWTTKYSAALVFSLDKNKVPT